MIGTKMCLKAERALGPSVRQGLMPFHNGKAFTQRIANGTICALS